MKKRIIAVSLLFAPSLVYIILQTIFIIRDFGFIEFLIGMHPVLRHGFNISVFLVFVLTINFNIARHYKEKDYIIKQQRRVLEDDKYVLIIKFMALLCAIIMCIGSFHTYNFFGNNSKIKDAKLVTATIVKAEDKSEPSQEKCEITMYYELDGKEYEIVEMFDNISAVSDRKIQIYVKDDEFVCTYNDTISRKILTIYFLVLALLNLIVVIFGVDEKMISSIPALVSANLLAVLAPFAIFEFIYTVSFKQIFIATAGALLVQLSIVGFYGLVGNAIGIIIKHRKKDNIDYLQNEI